MSINTSPDKGSYNIKIHEERLLMDPDDSDAVELIDYFKSNKQLRLELEATEEWRVDNLEYDLRSSRKIIEKCTDPVYAQHVYAALCNNEFQKNDVYPILSDKRWSCSWRHAGGIIADIRQQGDYIDWYCSGIRGDILTDEEFNDLTEEQKQTNLEIDAYINEGVVTDEIRKDFFELGWIILGER